MKATDVLDRLIWAHAQAYLQERDNVTTAQRIIGSANVFKDHFDEDALATLLATAVERLAVPESNQ